MSSEYLDEEVKEHEAEMKAIRERQEVDREPTIEKHEDAMEAMNAAMMELNGMNERDEKEISAAMQAFETKVAARRVYHEAPDVFDV